MSPESNEEEFDNPEEHRESRGDSLSTKTENKSKRAKDAYDKESPNSDAADADDGDKMKQSLRRSPRSKSSLPRMSRTTSKTAIVVEDDTRKEDDQVVGRTMRSDTHSMKIKTSKYSSFKDDTINEDDQVAGHSTREKPSHSTSSHPITKDSKTGTATASPEDDAYKENDQIVSRTARRSTYNTSSSRRISDSSPSKLAKPANTLLSASDIEDEVHDNKRRSSRNNIRKGSPRSVLKASRTEISTVADDDTQEKDDQVLRRSTRGSTYNKSSSRRISDSPKAAKTASTLLPGSDTDDEIDENKQRSSRIHRHERSSRSVPKSATPKALRTRISTVPDDDDQEEDDQVLRRSTRGSTYNKSSSRRISDSPKAAKTITTLFPGSDTDDEIDENKRRSSRINTQERSSRRKSRSITTKASRTKISAIVEDDAHEEDDQAIRRNTRRSTRKSSSRRISDIPPSKAANTTTTLLAESDTDDEIVENKRRSPRINTQERSSRRKSGSITTKASRSQISTIAEDDAHEDDDEVIGRNARRSTHKSSSRRISDSPPSKVAKTTTMLLAESDTDDEIVEKKRRSSRISTQERSSRRISGSITTKASRTQISTIAEDDDQVIRRNTRRSTLSKSSVTRSKNGLDLEVSVIIKKLPASVISASKSPKTESMILVDDKENSTHEPKNPSENTAKEKLTHLDDDENDEEEDEDDTETFQLVASRNGRSSTTFESVGRHSRSRIFRGRSAKYGVSYEDDGDFGAEADMESIERPKPTSFRKPRNRVSRTSKLKHSTLSDERVSANNESTSEKMRPGTRTKAVSEERRSNQISNVPAAKTTEESVANVERNDDPSVHLTHLVGSSRKSSTTEHRFEISSDSENSDLEIVSRAHKKEATMQSIVHKRRSDASSTSDEEETGKETEIVHSENIGRKSVNNTPRGKSLNPATGRNQKTKSTTNLRDANFTQDNASTEEDQDTAKSGATVASSLEKGNKARDMFSINISNISSRSPLLSSTRRSMFPTALSKRASKLPSQRSSKFSTTDNPSILPVDHEMDADFVVQEDERHEPDNRKSGKRTSRVSGSDQKQLADGSTKTPNTAQALASSSLANNAGDVARQIEHGFHRVNNTIPEETTASYTEPAQNDTEEEQSAQNRHSIAKQQNRANEDIEKRTITDKSIKKGMPGKSQTKEHNLEKVFNQKESGTQRSLIDFLQGKEQKASNYTLFSTQTDSQSQLPSASQVLSDPSKMKEFRKQMEDFLKNDNTLTVQKKPNVPPSKEPKPVKKVTTLLKSKPNVKPKKPLDNAYLVNGKVYKPPPLIRPKYWVSNRLYQYFDKFLLPKYGISARVRSEKFIRYLTDVTTLVEKRKKYSNYKDDVDRLMIEMAHLGIIKNRNDFYNFCHYFLPYELRVKLVPMIRPGNEPTIPYNPNELYTPLLK